MRDSSRTRVRSRAVIIYSISHFLARAGPPCFFLPRISSLPFRVVAGAVPRRWPRRTTFLRLVAGHEKSAPRTTGFNWAVDRYPAVIVHSTRIGIAARGIPPRVFTTAAVDWLRFEPASGTGLLLLLVLLTEKSPQTCAPIASRARKIPETVSAVIEQTRTSPPPWTCWKTKQIR